MPDKSDGVFCVHSAPIDDISDIRRRTANSAVGTVRAAIIQGNNMFSQFKLATLAALNSLKHSVGHSGSFIIVAHHTMRGLLATAKQTLMLLGLISLGLAGMVYAKPESLHRIQASLARISPPPASQSQPILAQATNESGISPSKNPVSHDTPFNPARYGNKEANLNASKFTHKFSITPATMANAGWGQSDAEIQQQQQVVAAWLSKRYRVAYDATLALVGTTYQTGQETELDPLLILAVMAIESGFNPIAESPMGAQGLMQVMSKIHHARFQKLGGVKEALNPVANIKVGTMILRDFVVRGGSIEAGLKSYVGAAAFVNDSGYGSRVLAEYNRLKQVASGNLTANGTPQVLPIAKNPAPLLEEAKAGHKEEVAAL
jgi:soluble lytic murein transglycosylase-like protein